MSMVAPGRPTQKNRGEQCLMMVFTMSWETQRVRVLEREGDQYSPWREEIGRLPHTNTPGRHAWGHSAWCCRSVWGSQSWVIRPASSSWSYRWACRHAASPVCTSQSAWSPVQWTTSSHRYKSRSITLSTFTSGSW
jgi:hypothetical protein